MKSAVLTKQGWRAVVYSRLKHKDEASAWSVQQKNIVVALYGEKRSSLDNERVIAKMLHTRVEYQQTQRTQSAGLSSQIDNCLASLLEKWAGLKESGEQYHTDKVGSINPIR